MAISITILGVRAISTKANIIMGFWWLQWSWHHEIHSESTGEKVRIFLSWNGAPILWHSWRAITTPHEPSWWAVFLITCHHDGRSSYSHTVMTGCHLMSWWAIVLKACHHLQGDRPLSSRWQAVIYKTCPSWWTIIFKVTGHHLQGDLSLWVIIFKTCLSWQTIIFKVMHHDRLSSSTCWHTGDCQQIGVPMWPT